MYSNLLRSTQRLIQKYGKDCTYSRITEGTYNVNTSAMTPETEVQETVRSYRSKISYSESQNPNLIGKDSAVYVIAGRSITFIPSVGDRITNLDDSTEYEILVVNKIDVQSEVGLWRLICIKS
jgi:hypothetical protein